MKMEHAILHLQDTIALMLESVATRYTSKASTSKARDLCQSLCLWWTSELAIRNCLLHSFLRGWSVFVGFCSSRVRVSGPSLATRNIQNKGNSLLHYGHNLIFLVPEDFVDQRALLAAFNSTDKLLDPFYHLLLYQPMQNNHSSYRTSSLRPAFGLK